MSSNQPASNSQQQSSTPRMQSSSNGNQVGSSGTAMVTSTSVATSDENSVPTTASNVATTASTVTTTTSGSTATTSSNNISPNTTSATVQPSPLVSALDTFITNATVRQNNSLKHVADYVRKTDDLLFNHLQKLDQALALLNTADNSLAIAQILWVKLSCVPLDANMANTVEPLIFQVISFLKEAQYGDFEVHGLDIFTRMCRAFASLLVSRNRTSLGIQPLRNVIKLLHKDGELVYIMTSFLYLCLKSKNFKPALEILDIDIVEIRHEGPKSEISDVLLYFYYGGCCYLAVKNVARANLFFEIAISTPATAISRIMVEAYKKYILTSFILYGKLKDCPVKASSSANTFLRTVKNTTQTYLDIFTCKSASEVIELQTKNEVLFREDENYGLIKQCVVSMYKRNIHKLTKTFLTLSLADITTAVSLSNVSQTEKYLSEMIQDGQICAQIDQQQGMIYFLDNTVDSTGDIALQKLSAQISKCVQINSKFQELDDSIKTSVVFQEKLHRSNSGGSDTLWEYPHSSSAFA